MFCKSHKGIVLVLYVLIYLVEKTAWYLVILKAFLNTQITALVMIGRV